MTNPKDLHEALSAQPKLDEIAEEIEQKAEKKEESPFKNETDPRAHPVWTFDFKWEDETGRKLEGTFTNKVLTIGDRQKKAIIQAKLNGEIPINSLDPGIVEVNEMIAHLTCSLTNTPPWAKNLLDLTSVRLLEGLYLEVLGHEHYFHFHRAPTLSSEG